MRVRLLLDTELNDEKILEIQKLIAEQPSAEIRIEGYSLLGARLMGATPVEVNQ